MLTTTVFTISNCRTRLARLATRGLFTSALAGLLAGVLSMSGCGGDGDSAERGPLTLSVAGAKLDGLYWDNAESRLYLGDDATNAVRRWDGGAAFPIAVALTPAPASGATVGQLTRGPDGARVVTRFGYGTDGTLVVIPASGVAYDVAGLDATRRRIGLTSAPDGALIDTWFVRGASGAVSEVTLQASNRATERELVTGLGKPVGVAVQGDRLIIGDQATGKVLAYSLATVRRQPATATDGTVLAAFGAQEGIDLIAAGPDGKVFVGGSTGKLYAIDAQGAVATLASGWPGVRGLAYDERNRRLFAAVAAAEGTSSPTIRILPID